MNFGKKGIKSKYKRKDDYKSRIIVTTDYENGYLREVCSTLIFKISNSFIKPLIQPPS